MSQTEPWTSCISDLESPICTGSSSETIHLFLNFFLTSVDWYYACYLPEKTSFPLIAFHGLTKNLKKLWGGGNFCLLIPCLINCSAGLARILCILLLQGPWCLLFFNKLKRRMEGESSHITFKRLTRSLSGGKSSHVFIISDIWLAVRVICERGGIYYHPSHFRRENCQITYRFSPFRLLHQVITD